MKYFRKIYFTFTLFNVYLLVQICTAGHDKKNVTNVIPRRLQEIAYIEFQGEIPDDLINLYAPVFSKSPKCQTESMLYKKSLNMFEPWALQMWDSSGKIPSGLMHEHFHDLGNYPECLEVPHLGPYEVQYCTIQLGNLVSDWYSGIDWKSEDTIFGAVPMIKPHFYLGRCFPASCDQNDLYAHFENVTKRFNVTFHINKYSCTASNEELPYLAVDWLAACVLTTTLVFLIFSTLFDNKTPKEKREGRLPRLLLSFSLYSNFKQLIKIGDPNRPLSILNGLKSISMLWIMCGHFLVFYLVMPSINYATMIEIQYSPLVALIATGALAVDVFILISGFLISYLFLHEIKKKKKFNVPVYYLLRIVRIIPLYSVQILFAMTLLYRYAGNGPMWKDRIGRIRDNCFKNWWTNLLFLNNYVHPNEQCVPSSWYLAVDTQMYIMAPFFLFPMTKWKLFRNIIVPILILFFNIWTVYTSYIFDFKAGALFNRDLTTEMTNYLYISTHSRMGVWLLGISLGYYLQSIKGKNIKLSKMQVSIGWLATGLIHLFMIGSMLIFLDDTHEFPTIIHSLYNGFHRTIYAAGICWIIFACELGYGGVMYKILSWWPFQIFGKLTFVLYVSHVGFMYALQSSNISSNQFIFTRFIRDLIGDLVACIPIGIISSLMFEVPYINIGRIFFQSRRLEVESNNKEKPDNIEDLSNIGLEKVDLTNRNHNENGV